MTANESAVTIDRLEEYLERQGISVAGIEVMADGLNVLCSVSTPAESNAYVLRRPNKLRESDLFNGLRAEYRLLSQLAETSVPTPEPIHYCTDTTVFDGEWFLMEYLEGAPIPLGSDHPQRFCNPTARRTLAHGVVDRLAAIHTLSTAPFDDVCERQTPLEQVAIAKDRLETAATVTGRAFPRLRDVGTWLEDNAPTTVRTTLVHGDYRPGNLLFADDEPTITGVLDWETAMLGDPLTELGYLLLRWRDEGDPTPCLDSLESKYAGSDALEQLRETNERGLAPFTAEPGSPTRQELVSRYEQRTGYAFEHERFYRAHAAFMLATVWVDLHRHDVEAGCDSDWEPHIEYMAMVATAIVDGELSL
ncbi:phosphotransferase family protein [Halobacteria archaeon AArc-curdl1]|uniref:Phosphotransferase family protein n=1 Tax=Natronosalvus hydrolyticus TaxID=2979988 RepID=A0AAP3E7V5_9EURY|nr:phosphotransferase family protein [Halobacteria archaeon AArc-curdl1]